MTKRLHFLLPIFLVALLLGACAAPTAAPAPSAGQPTAAQPTQAATSQPAPANDLLADVMARGTLRVSTDPAYPPQSELVPDAKRPADTKCGSDEHAAAELSGFDIGAAVELAKRLGVEPCFVTPDWTLITGGSWADRWDISIGSMTVTPERMQKLYFSQPYYTTPAAFFVYKDNTTYAQPADLSGKKIGGCSGCTYEYYVDGTLAIPGETIDFVVKDATFNGYESDLPALQDLSLGDGVRLDAVLTALPTGQGAIKDGLPLKQLGDPVYFEYLAGAMDKASSRDSTAFRAKVSEIIQAMHADGTLKSLSEKYYGVDLAAAAGKFDLKSLNQ